jgi:hypothetical protein
MPLMLNIVDRAVCTPERTFLRWGRGRPRGRPDRVSENKGYPSSVDKCRVGIYPVVILIRIKTDVDYTT